MAKPVQFSLMKSNGLIGKRLFTRGSNNPSTAALKSMWANKRAKVPNTVFHGTSYKYSYVNIDKMHTTKFQLLSQNSKLHNHHQSLDISNILLSPKASTRKNSLNSTHTKVMMTRVSNLLEER